MNLSFDRFRLAASTADLSEEPAAREHADLVEFRMDLADDPEAQLDAYGGDLPLLATNRAVREGGESDAAEAERLGALAAAAERDAVVAADVELTSLREPAGTEAAEHVRAAGASVVASFHDFEATPEESRLRDLLAEATDRGDVGKLAVTAADRGDALALLAVTHAATAADRDVATMAMGAVGRHTRAVAPLYGSKLGYAPVDPAAATAPGQYDLAALSDLVAALAGEDAPADAPAPNVE